jgi:Zn-dependent protease with chaperone function
LAASGDANAQVGDNPPPRDPSVEASIHEQLAVSSPDAAALFAAATDALDAGAYADAAMGFQHVLELAPRSADAFRRLSQAQLGLGDWEDARASAFSAYGLDPSAPNMATLAEALLAASDEASAGEALRLARSAARLLPDDAAAMRLHVRAAAAARDVDEAQAACEALAEPGDFGGEYSLLCTAFALSDEGRWVEAEELLNGASGSEVPGDVVDWALDNDIRLRAWLARRLYLVGWIMVTYALGPLVFVGYGIGLGRMTVAAARRAAHRGDVRVSRAERFMHTTYRFVILLTSTYYYASIPFLWLALVAAWIGAFLQAYAGQPLWPRVGVIVALMITQYILATVYVGLTARTRHPDPGHRLSRADAPGIWRMVDDLAQEMETRPIDAIFAIPDARINVLEVGRNRDLLRGRGQRCLVLGLGLLPGMTANHLRAILAHEYAHFTNRDTAGGQIARQVHASMQRITVQLTMVGLNNWFSPGWWYASVYSRIFLLVTMGASRLHEILADRTAARICGVTVFIDALRHIVRQDHIFSAQVRSEMRLAKQEDRPVSNLYALPPLDGAESVEAEGRIASTMERPTSTFDTHLSTGERIDLLSRLETPDACGDDPAAVWELLADPIGLQCEMTDVVRATVRRREDRLLQAVAEAHDANEGRVRSWLRRATWFWRAARRADGDK